MHPTLPILSPAELPFEPEGGFGALTTSRGALPLVALDVRARLAGLTAGVEVEQVFVNTYAEALEATYIFPLPDRAAVTRFELQVAGRTVEGQLQERKQARQTYDQALQAGHRAALAEEERPGVFTLRVGNLPPGERAVVRLTLAGPLPYRDGEVTFRFPLVVAPRYVPGAPVPGPAVGAGTSADTDRAPDASRISPPVLLPGFASPVRLALSVTVAESALGPHSFRSTLHTIAEEAGPQGRLFRVLPGERLDCDFVFRYRVGGERVVTDLAVRPDAGGDEGTFLLTLVPPVGAVAPRPRAVIFVLDRSGSMGGWKMVAARRAVARMIETLTEEDRFSIYAFDDQLEAPTSFDGLALVPGSDRARCRAVDYLNTLEARGGTEMAAPLEKALEELGRALGGHGDRVLVLITDGQIANEDEVLRRLGRRAAGARLFTLGIDRAVNAAFLRRLADLGGGACEVVESEARLDEVMDTVHRHIGTPVLTGLGLHAAGLDLRSESVVPGRLPDLFAGAPVLISGRYRGRAAGVLTVRAHDSAGAGWSVEVPAHVEGSAPLGPMWARGRLRELEDRYAAGGDKAGLEREIVETSLRFGALSRFTAFVAVDHREVVNPGGEVRQVVQPVELPQGWGRQEADALAGGPGIGGVACRSLAASAPSGAFRRLTGPARASKTPPPATALPLSEEGAAPSSLSGLFGRFLGLIGLGRDKGPHEQADLDRRPFRARAQTLHDRLTGPAATTPAGRLGALRQHAAELQALVEALVKAGDRHESVDRLGRAAVAVLTHCAGGALSEEVIAQHHRAVVEALAAWLALVPADITAGSAGRREGFWK